MYDQQRDEDLNYRSDLSLLDVGRPSRSAGARRHLPHDTPRAIGRVDAALRSKLTALYGSQQPIPRHGVHFRKVATLPRTSTTTASHLPDERDNVLIGNLGLLLAIPVRTP